MERDEVDEKTLIIRNALAEYFECNPDTIGAFAVCCERQAEDETPRFSSAWSALPHWHMLGFVEELKSTIEQQRVDAQLQNMMSGDNS